MNYISTRGNAQKLDFEQVTLTGLAADGGLYLPTSWPQYSNDDMRALRQLDYRQLAVRVLSSFSGEILAQSKLETLVDNAYSDFDHAAIAPLKQLDSSLFLSELFHGPTFAFKDYALQVLGQLFNHFLQQRDQRLTIVGATSGDTGSAAIEAVRGLAAVELFMLHPLGRVSEVQRRQMTTVLDSNIHNIAVKGTFDDCQNMVKALFNDADFKRRHTLSAVNSINWARIAAQVVYYFYHALALGAPERQVEFAVPTGNFGNVFAGVVAKRMGLPIRRFIIGSNRNNILTRFFETGVMQTDVVNPSLSPSMDIQISSNFERYLFELYDHDAKQVSALMQELAQQGHFVVDADKLRRAQSEFSAYCVDDDETLAEIARVYTQTGEIVDPHSVIGIRAARALMPHDGTPVIVLGTAHPAKFSPAVKQATGIEVTLPQKLEKIMSMEEKYLVLENDLEAVKSYIERVKG